LKLLLECVLGVGAGRRVLVVERKIIEHAVLWGERDETLLKFKKLQLGRETRKERQQSIRDRRGATSNARIDEHTISSRRRIIVDWTSPCAKRHLNTPSLSFQWIY
jgi:hypothetical protein